MAHRRPVGAIGFTNWPTWPATASWWSTTSRLRRTTMAMLLRAIGQEVEIRNDGTAALEWLATGKADVVFLDISMPGMDGYEVARRIRAMPHLHNLVLVALTGYGQDEDRRRAFEAGFNHHLVKPVSIEALSNCSKDCRSPEWGRPGEDADGTINAGRVRAAATRAMAEKEGPMAASLPRVVIIGGGFGGLNAAQSLAKAPVRVTLIDRRNHHLFQPLLYQVATAALNPSDIASPIRRDSPPPAKCRGLLADVRSIATGGARQSSSPRKAPSPTTT